MKFIKHLMPYLKPTMIDLSIKPQKERLAHTIKRVGELDFFNKVEELKKS